MDQQRWASTFYTGREQNSRCDFCCCSCVFPWCRKKKKTDDFHAIFTKAVSLSLSLFVTSIHVQLIQKGETAFTQSQSQHSGYQPVRSITTQLQYLWELLLMERPFHRLSPSPPHISLSPSFFCGPHSFPWAYFNEKFGGESLGIWRRLSFPQHDDVNNYERPALKTPTEPRINTLAKYRRIKSRIALNVAPLCPRQPQTINHIKWLKNEMFITMASDGERKARERARQKWLHLKRVADKRGHKCSHQGEYLLIHLRRRGKDYW